MLSHVGKMMQTDLLSVMRTLPAQSHSQILDLMVKHLCQAINFAFPHNANTFCRGFAETNHAVTRGGRHFVFFHANHMYSFIRNGCVLKFFLGHISKTKLSSTNFDSSNLCNSSVVKTCAKSQRSSFHSSLL